MQRAKILATLFLISASPEFAQLIKSVCASCHPAETKSYLASSMGRSLGPPDIVPAGLVSDSQSGSLIRSEWRKSKMFHRLSENGIVAEYQIRYQIGAGKVGHSYAAQAGDFLLESPASYFRRFGWDVSPGFSGAELLDFNRVLTGRCLFCHSNSTGISQERPAHAEELVAIGCQRCHGKTDEHVKRPSAANVVNPAKLPARARDSVCEQCHLEGAARVLNPGKTLSTFEPGTNLEDTLAIYVMKQTGSNGKAVSQEEQLALSQCLRGSEGKLWCGTCHNPHRSAKNRDSEIKAICLSCHSTLSPARHSPHVSECTSCHMPRRAPTDVAHAALTDHRILAQPNETPPHTIAANSGIEAWREPLPQFRQRDLGLADLQASALPGFQQLGEAAANLLQSLPPHQQNDDAATIAALGDIALAQGRVAEGLSFLHRACNLLPSSGEYALFLAIALKRNADSAGAVREFKRALQLDPSLQQAYLDLAAIYAKQGRPSEADEVLSEYLKWNPQSVLVRLTKEELAAGKK